MTRVDELEGRTLDEETEVPLALVVVTSVPGSRDVVVRAEVASGW
jgi:hypothetical protein